MSQIVETILNDVCLDERIRDGIFRMEENEHMAALRDYLMKKGLTKEAVTHISNQMVEGLNYGDRQAIRKEDGIIVTWPSPKHKAKAFKENPGKYVEEEEAIRLGIYTPKEKSSGTTPKEPVKRELPVDNNETPTDDKDDNSAPRSVGNIFDKEPAKVTQGDKQLDVEPPHGIKPPTPVPVAPVPPVSPRTPQRISAEKEVAMQIMMGNNNNLSNIDPPIDEECRRQLNELYKKADELGYNKAITFLTKYVKS